MKDSSTLLLSKARRAIEGGGDIVSLWSWRIFYKRVELSDFNKSQ